MGQISKVGNRKINRERDKPLRMDKACDNCPFTYPAKPWRQLPIIRQTRWPILWMSGSPFPESSDTCSRVQCLLGYWVAAGMKTMHIFNNMVLPSLRLIWALPILSAQNATSVHQCWVAPATKGQVDYIVSFWSWCTRCFVIIRLDTHFRYILAILTQPASAKNTSEGPTD